MIRELICLFLGFVVGGVFVIWQSPPWVTDQYVQDLERRVDQ